MVGQSVIGLVYQSTVFQTRGVTGADASRKEFQIENARTSGGLYHTLPRLEEIMTRFVSNISGHNGQHTIHVAHTSFTQNTAQSGFFFYKRSLHIRASRRLVPAP